MKKDNPEFKMFKNIEVAVIGNEKLTEILTKELEKPYQPWGAVCIVTNTKGEVGMFNYECIGSIECKKDYPFMIDAYPILGEGRFAMMPTASLGLSVEEAKKIAVDHGVKSNMKDFMEDRFCYNSRIESNMYEFKKWYETGE